MISAKNYKGLLLGKAHGNEDRMQNACERALKSGWAGEFRFHVWRMLGWNDRDLEMSKALKRGGQFKRTTLDHAGNSESNNPLRGPFASELIYQEDQIDLKKVRWIMQKFRASLTPFHADLWDRSWADGDFDLRGAGQHGTGLTTIGQIAREMKITRPRAARQIKALHAEFIAFAREHMR